MSRPTCEHVTATTDPDLAAMVYSSNDELASILRAMAERGGGPGTGCIVFTDVRNARWFYGPGEGLPGIERAEAECDPSFPVSLARELPEVIRRVALECPVCAQALIEAPGDHVALYLRIGTTAETFVGSVPFPEELRALERSAPKRRRGITHLINGVEVAYTERGRRT